MDSVILWTKIVGLATAIFGAIAAGLKLYERFSSNRKVRDGKSALERGALAVTALHLVMEKLHGHRAILIRAHNGGGPLDPAKRTYTSVELEARDRSLPARVVDWKDRTIDAHYMGLMQRVSSEEVVTLVTEKLPQESILRGVYETDGVTGAIVFRLWNTDSDFFFISVALTCEDPMSALELTPQKREAIRAAKTVFRRLLRDREVFSP